MMTPMKRDPRLRGLSSDHHQALVLARTLRARTAPWTADDGAALARRFDRELEPHFRTEEEVLLPALGRAGAADLVERTAADHAFLRARVAAARLGDGAAAGGFAARLADHVHFEERELFPACERLLDDAVLDEVARRAPPPEPAPG
jgi:hemerythrin-like domain-containing protein